MTEQLSDKSEPRRAPSFLAGLVEKLWAPAQELTVHFILSILAIGFIFLVEKALDYLELAKKPVPVLNISFEQWMFDLDVLSVSSILLLGLVKALWEMRK